MIPRSIVVPLDGSELAERAIPIATELAAQLNAGLVFARTTYGDVRYAHSYLEHLAKLSGRSDIEEVVLVDENAPRAIAEIVEEHPGSMVCMTTHGRGRLGWTLAGSVAEDVIKESSEPLLLVGPHADDAWSPAAHKVVVCADGTPGDQATITLACEWAHALDLEIHIVCVFHPRDLEADHPERVFAPLTQVASSAGLRVHTHQLFQSSFVAEALARFAEDEKAALLVMGAHHHGAFARIALGSTSMATVHSAVCPVLVTAPGDNPPSPRA
jgi:nucleotide-binding universal stress UspA family protein